MGLQDCQILLDNPWNTYYAGQTVNGQVKLHLDSPKKIRGKIFIHIYVCMSVGMMASYRNCGI